MKLFLFASILGLFLASSSANLINFYNMIIHTTKRNPLDYVNYGCYCGFRGLGDPIDELDQCCYEHDLCYREARKLDKCSPELIQYEYSLADKEPYCLADNNECKYKTCECDRIAAICFSQKKYNPQNKVGFFSFYRRFKKCFKN